MSGSQGAQVRRGQVFDKSCRKARHCWQLLVRHPALKKIQPRKLLNWQNLQVLASGSQFTMYLNQVPVAARAQSSVRSIVSSQKLWTTRTREQHADQSLDWSEEQQAVMWVNAGKATEQNRKPRQ